MVGTRRSATLKSTDGRFISSRTRSSQSRPQPREKPVKKDTCSEGSLSDGHLSPPAKRPCKHAEPVHKETLTAKQREGWNISTRRSSHSSLSLGSRPRHVEKEEGHERSCMNGPEVRRSCRPKSNRFRENMDMYSRVKRRRKESQEEGEDGDEEVEVEGEENDRPYNLRQEKTVERYQAPPIEPAHQRKRQSTLFDTHRSPARRSHLRRKKHAIHTVTQHPHHEERFERRKSKSMAKARNSEEDLASGILRERVRFDSVGGLSEHIYALKEMVVFPLLYPEIFEKFRIQPPRGCLFYGPPGTGKTLVARALANECSQGDKKVSFFMRKGADCLSKWVGESERQLRLLFDQAYVMRPSIIFFDEIDGLAPVRSSRQDQIHSSIVSTLLALMDGLDNRGEIVVIGATNRLDSIDPALRRPGRFDREFLFGLPDQKARKHILQIHTRDWNPKLSDQFLEELAEKCVGYCGADIKALCTEAALIALRRRYPQIYASSQKLQLDISSVVLGAHDFYHAMKNIVPASQRAVMSPGHALSPVIRPLLERTFSNLQCVLHKVFPHSEFSQNNKKDDAASLLLDDSEDENTLSIFDASCVLGSPKKQPAALHKPFLHFTTSACYQPTSYRPRLLLAGEPGSGQTSHLAPAVLHTLEKFSVHRLDLPTLYSVSAKTPEESCAQVFREARRSVPSIVYMPHIGDWWDAVGETVKATFLTLLQDLPSFSPILLLSTSETMYSELPEEVRCIFRIQYEEVFIIHRPNQKDRLNFFQDIILNQAATPPPCQRKAAMRALEVLPPALPPQIRQLSEAEKQRMEDHEENTLRELRLFLRDVTKRLATDKRFSIFSKPVSDYLEVIRVPMDLSTIMTKIDKHQYLTAKDFLLDVDLICSNALEYNPDKEPGDKIIRHRACTLKDTAHAIIAAELDPEFNKHCEEIKEIRTKRGVLITSEQLTSQSSVAQKAEFGPDEAFQDKNRTAPNNGSNSGTKCSFTLRKKHRRRSQWGRGIIKKKKSTYILKKEYEQDSENPGDILENGDLEVSTDCLEENGEETGDLSVTNDESSCDIMDGEAEQPNGKGSSLASTEEESSNESLLVNNIDLKKENLSTNNPAFVPDCVNGHASVDSLDSVQMSELQNGNLGIAGAPAAVAEKQKDLLEHPVGQTKSAVNCHNLTKCQSSEIHEQTTAEPAQSKEDYTGPEVVEMEDNQEVPGEQPKEPALEAALVPDPPLVVDHDRLQRLLDVLVKKSNNITVDQLERWYSLLSQCIYQHRKEYDKTKLVEDMERTVHTFETFL
ncbi:hypothetical protein GDO86_010484 [Hymenochirus boettgeri]|uniref:Bromo domain-containing protein n=1 Tax=Hymenochirus boettgeri TaxID=247094 RepID=A0A8T2JN83_9PIPI|nr:hypothetical protein GDO86_010484 [Hymenochirus boettgeri]